MAQALTKKRITMTMVEADSMSPLPWPRQVLPAIVLRSLKHLRLANKAPLKPLARRPARNESDKQVLEALRTQLDQKVWEVSELARLTMI